MASAGVNIQVLSICFVFVVLIFEFVDEIMWCEN